MKHSNSRTPALMRLLATAALFGVTAAHATYNSNTSGVVVSVATYSDGDYIYFSLNPQPTTHNSCNPQYFVIGDDVPQNRRNQMLATLLAAKGSAESITVGYDSNGNCAHGYIRVHRVG
jgi:hypothetical protein